MPRAQIKDETTNQQELPGAFAALARASLSVAYG